MSDVALYEAKNRLSELIRRVEEGEEIGITRRGKVVARLVPRAAIDALRTAREGVTLGRLHSRDLIREGRRSVGRRVGIRGRRVGQRGAACLSQPATPH